MMTAKRHNGSRVPAKPRVRETSLFFDSIRKPHTYSNFTIGRYRLRGKSLSFLFFDKWVPSECPLKEFKEGITEGCIVPVVPSF